MSIAILFNQKNANDWLDKLKEHLPKTKIEVYPSIEKPNEVEFLLTWKPHLDYTIEFPNLKVIQSVGAGVDHVLQSNVPKNVAVSRIVDENLKQDLFEYCLTCVFDGMKNFTFYHDQQLKKEWTPIKYKSINHITLTILGLGEIGLYVAEQFTKLGFKVYGWSKNEKEIDEFKTFFGQEQLDNALIDSDIVINILPLTNATENILNLSLFEKFKKKSVLINVGRGGHLNDEDLLTALDLGFIQSAYLDVFREEPLPKEHIFWSRKNIFITPHVASLTNINTAVKQVVDNYVKLKKGEKLNHVVDLSRGY